VTPAPLPLPSGISLLDVAQILAAAATIAALAVAWVAYASDEKRGREELRRGVLNVLVAVEPEMKLVKHWAAGPDGNGYPQVTPGIAPGEDVASYQHYREQMPEWLNPMRSLIPIVCPAIQALPTSPYAAQLAPLIEDVSLLNLALETLAAAERSRAAFVNENADLVARMVRIWIKPNQRASWVEQDFMDVVFLHNYTIHVELIGSAATANDNVLHRAYIFARRALDDFKGTWEAALPPAPRWHRYADAAARVLLVVAGGLVLMLLWKALEPLPTMLWRAFAR